ncbi:uncharacterized protein CANTADRAFT_42393, partial [Suhomyces tanzawaensis NRRL Y-17324]
RRAYELYYYFLPLSVMSSAERYIFNSISLVLVSLASYYVMFILPRLMARTLECLYYYATGNFISIN